MHRSGRNLKIIFPTGPVLCPGVSEESSVEALKVNKSISVSISANFPYGCVKGTVFCGIVTARTP
jgi:hypothetical protein